MAITKFFVKSFGLKPAEGVKFTLLFFHSFFLGLFIAFYFVPANSVFIQYHGSESLPIAYIVSGIAGYLVSFIYSYLRKKVGNRKLFLGAVAFMFLVTLFARISLVFGNPEISSFFVFVWAWPFISLVGIVSGGLALQFLNLIQVKRLYGLVNMGSVIASILGYMAIPMLLTVLNHPYDLLYIGNAGLIVAVFILLSLFRRVDCDSMYSEEDDDEDTQKSNDKKSSIFKNKYITLIFTSAVISMIIIYIVDFSFLSSVNVQKTLFPSPESVSNYLSYVYGGLKIGEMIISYYSSRLLSNYGVKLGLTILPISITLIVASAAVVGLTLGVATILFLVLMTINKSMERILRRGLDDPAFNVLYQPLPSDQKMEVQTKVGMVMQGATALAGIALLAMNFVLKTETSYRLEYFPLMLLPFLILWVIVASRLYIAYKGQLKQILLDMGKNRKRKSSRYVYGSELLTRNFKNNNEQAVEMSVSLLSETNPRIIEPYAANLLGMPNNNIKTAILRKIDTSWRPRILNTVKKIYISDKSKDIRQLALNVKEILDYSELPETVDDDTVQTLLESNRFEDKLLLQKLIIKKIIPVSDELLKNLLNYDNKIIKTATIHIIGKYKFNDFMHELVALIESDEYYHVCGDALLTTGDKALDQLNTYFHNHAQRDVLRRIIEIFAKIGSTKAKKILLSHINYPDRIIQHEIITALSFCKYQAKDSDFPVVKAKLEETIENILWIYACIIDIEEQRNTLKLMQAIDLDREISFEMLFKLLSFMYAPRIINLIRKNIIGQNTIFALEIIDNFISQDIKQLINPLFDEIPISQKIKKLNDIFPQKKMSFYNRLNEIVTQDYNKLSLWTVSKAIEVIGKLHSKVKISNDRDNQNRNYNDVNVWTQENIAKILHKIKRSEIPDEVFVCLFHSDEIVYSTAAKVIFDENPIKCAEYLEKMSEPKQEMLSELNHNGFLLADKIKLLKKNPMFFTVPENFLAELARLTTIKFINKDESISAYNKKGNSVVIIIVKGSLQTTDHNGDVIHFNKNDIIIPGINIHKSVKELTAYKPTNTILIDKYDYFNTLLDCTSIINYVLGSMS